MKAVVNNQKKNMGRPNHVKARFAQVLKLALLGHFGGRLPSNAVIAREFNLRAFDTEPVTQESVRRWMRGISMPDEIKMKVLVSWLDLDLKACFGQESERLTNAALDIGNHENNQKRDVGNGRPEVRLNKNEMQILKLIESLPAVDKRLVVELAKKLSTRANA